MFSLNIVSDLVIGCIQWLTLSYSTWVANLLLYLHAIGCLSLTKASVAGAMDDDPLCIRLCEHSDSCCHQERICTMNWTVWNIFYVFVFILIPTVVSGTTIPFVTLLFKNACFGVCMQLSCPVAETSSKLPKGALITSLYDWNVLMESLPMFITHIPQIRRGKNRNVNAENAFSVASCSRVSRMLWTCCLGVHRCFQLICSQESFAQLAQMHPRQQVQAGSFLLWTRVTIQVTVQEKFLLSV